MRNILDELHCHSHLYAFIFIFVTLSPPVKSSESILSSSQTISNQTLVSSKNIYELGFFSDSNSENWFVGIWYKSIPNKTVVWVANRDNPVKSPSRGALKIGADGNLQILGAENSPVWSTNHTKSAINPVAELLDSGNFILRDANDADPKNYLWQSFDFPTDTLLPGMKLGWDLKNGFERYIRSWNSSSDPSSGEHAFRLDPRGFAEFFLWQGKEKKYRSGPWNGLRFSGVPEMKPLPVLKFIFETNQDEVYYSFSLNDASAKSRLVVTDSSPQLQRFIWIESSKTWSSYWYAPKDQCDNYRECGSSGVCDANASPVCGCLNGFVPKNSQAWNLRDGTDGCVRNVELNCETDGFSLMANMKLPETTTAFVDEKMSLEDCRKACRKDCSCTAFSDRNITGGGSGCVMWTGELVDMRVYTAGGQNLYVRMPASLLPVSSQSNASRHGSSHRTEETITIVAVSAAIALLLCGMVLCFIRRKESLRTLFNRNTKGDGSRERSQDFLINEVVVSGKRDYIDDGNPEELELPLYDFSTILSATYKFSDESKVGEGGFGCVYKGVLPDGQEVAVKRLSKTSGQGVEEFMNEVRLIARLQHRNLVRLLGCCVEKDEKILIYEYLPHRSLDSILFTKERSSMLNWKIRFDIICGIARGLLYLHQDSRFRIIHRDLKASNILLDGDLNPKISDFGMARIFGRDQTEANTRRVVGTYGYMAPEYAMDGLFSIKSDVFSFGVLVLEIISGKKNRGFYYSDHELNLLGHSWNLWREQRGLELLDPISGDTYSDNEVLRCMQVGLLCVQESAEDRPTMSSVVLMLSSETATMLQPKQPGFSLRRNPIETDSLSTKQDESCTLNHVTVTILDGR